MVFVFFFQLVYFMFHVINVLLRSSFFWNLDEGFHLWKDLIKKSQPTKKKDMLDLGFQDSRATPK